MRRLIEFDCAGERLMGTLDLGHARTALLIVSGGNEIRTGAHRGMALLAQRIAALGVPVLRFDRRGIGDSTGTNRGYAASGPDIAAAAAALRAQVPRIERLVGFGNCDAATALALFHREAGLDALVLANPFAVAPQGDLPAPAAIRAHYADRLRDPRQWLRLVRGSVDFGKASKGLRAIIPGSDQEESPAQAMARALRDSDVPLTLLLAQGDHTARAFRAAWRKPAFRTVRARAQVQECDTASHSFARPGDQDWLFQQVRAALSE